MVSLKLQKRLAASVLKVGINRVSLDNHEIKEIATASSRRDVRKLIKERVINLKPVAIHSRARHLQNLAQKRLGRHMGYGKRKGTAQARLADKVSWMRRLRVLRNLLKRYRLRKKIDKQLFHTLYMRSKGNAFKSKRVLMETIFHAKAEQKRYEELRKQAEARKARAEKRRSNRQRQKTKALQDALTASTIAK